MTDTPDAAEREALAHLLYEKFPADCSYVDCEVTAERLIAAGFRRAPEPAREAMRTYHDRVRLKEDLTACIIACDERGEHEADQIAAAIIEAGFVAQPAPQQGGEGKLREIAARLVRAWNGDTSSAHYRDEIDYCEDMLRTALATPAPAAPAAAVTAEQVRSWHDMEELFPDSMCREGHAEIRYWSENGIGCPMCAALATKAAPVEVSEAMVEAACSAWNKQGHGHTIEQQGDWLAMRAALAAALAAAGKER